MQSCQGDHPKLAHYIGPNINVCLAMAKIFTQNAKVLHTLSYRLLTPDEISGQGGSDVHEQFMARVHESLGSQVLSRDLEDLRQDDTLQYDSLMRARGHVMGCKRDGKGNAREIDHANPILDTRVYQIEFFSGKATELSANVIAESIYTQ